MTKPRSRGRSLGVSKQRPIASRFFDLQMSFLALEEEVEEALCEAIISTAEDAPFEDITFDWYDASFEFKRTAIGWKPSPQMLEAFWSMGFSRCWICYEDGTEGYYWAK